MKINWGTGIVIAFVCFIAFIMYFVVSMSTNDKYDHDLVNENYYEQELKYQEDIDKEKKAKNLSENVKWRKSSEGIEIEFPSTMNYSDIKGTLHLDRPSNKTLDFKSELNLNSSKFIIPKDNLLEGRWNLKIYWNYKGNDYLFKELIVY
ncbi:MAG: cytochrome C oxidase Cbb3 [Bacteroidetes bacterium MedPE-SWsnd-G2]|nr:MAG: cytochrome C oxidase Cbb3 [Bacteroidetes bacterium MedPE-SWsnd-G2]